MENRIDQIMAIAEENGGDYDGRLEELLPWRFGVQDLSDPHTDVKRMLRVWHGDYIECYLFEEGAGERHGYLFREGLGFGYLSISENMLFQYFRYFFNREHARKEIDRGSRPLRTTKGLPSGDLIVNTHISDDDVPELLSLTRAVAIGYVAGDDYSGEVGDLVLHFGDLVTKSSHLGPPSRLP